MDPSDAASEEHVVLLGAGAVGLALGAFLVRGGARVTLAVRNPASVELPIRFDDEIGGDKVTFERAAVCTVAELPESVDHVVVCTRGEQLSAALAALSSHIDARVPVTIAAATLDDVRETAHRAGLDNPILHMGIGFASWPVAERRYRLFALAPGGTGIATLSGRAGAHPRNRLARLLRRGGLPVRPAPTRLFEGIFRTVLATEVAWLLAYERAGWDLDRLAADDELISVTGKAAGEAARLMREEAGLAARIAGALPDALHVRIARRRATHASEGYRSVWRHHGPKTAAQLRTLARQLERRAGGSLPPMLRALATPAPCGRRFVEQPESSPREEEMSDGSIDRGI